MASLALSQQSFCISDVAKLLGLQPKSLFKWLSENYWIFKRGTSHDWTAYQQRLQSHELLLTMVEFKGRDGKIRHNIQVRITEIGLNSLRRQFNATNDAA